MTAPSAHDSGATPGVDPLAQSSPLADGAIDNSTFNAAAINIGPEADWWRSQYLGFRGHFWLLAVMWTTAVACSLAWSYREQRQHIFDTARSHAKTAYEKDVVYRSWLNEHGGVYVPVTEKSQPNEHLAHIPRRDINTPDGKLTLVTPATATRQVYELESRSSGVRSHLTSLDPLNAQNAPDRWQSEALRLLESGHREVCAIEPMAAGAYLRLMRPLVTKKNCLKCHAHQGYKVGDIRGGICVSVPLAPLWNTAKMEILAVLMGYGFLWVIGLAGIRLGTRTLRKEVENRLSVEEQLKDKEIRLSNVAERDARLKAERTVSRNQAEHQLAGKIQARLLPSSPPLIPGFDLAGLSNPAEVTSGDYYDFLNMPDGCLGIVVADVSGHGMGPALLVTETYAYLRALAEKCSDVGEILTRLNKLLVEDIDEGYFVTLFLGRLNPADRSFVFAGAGHQSHLLDAGGEVKELQSTGLALGVCEDAVIESSRPITLQTSQIVLFLSDGILEAPGGNDDYYGIGRTLDLVQSNRDRPAREIVDELYRSAKDFFGDAPQSDDMTAVILKAE